MNSVRKKMKQGLVSQQEYRREALASTVSILQGADYQYSRLLGEGTFGSVVELHYAPLRATFAAKIVLQEYASMGEVRHWPSLSHKNILPLIASQHFSTAYTYVFLMPRYASAMDIRLSTLLFRMDRQALRVSISWLQDVLRGLQYLHCQGLFHLDVKCNNVLVSDDDSKAVLCDFGFVSPATEGTVNIYGSPFIFRPPEAHDGRSWSDFVSDYIPVEPTKFDSWTVGMMSLEMFTGFSFSHSARRWHDPRWPNEIYSTIYSVLQAKSFLALLRDTFPRSDVSTSQISALRNFIIGCLSLNPRKRPATDHALEHVLFDGDQSFPEMKNSVWSTFASAGKLEFLIGVYNGRAFHRSAVPVHVVHVVPPMEKQASVADPEPPAENRQQQLSEGEIPPGAIHALQAPRRRSRRKYWKRLFGACFPMLIRKRRGD